MPTSRPIAATRHLTMAIDLAGPAAFAVTYLLARSFPDATLALLAGSLFSLLADWMLTRRLAPLPLALGAFSAIFGGLSLVFHDARFIKIDTSVSHAAVGLVLLGGLALGFDPLKAIAGEFLKLADTAWRALTWRFALFNLGIALANEIVWRTQTDAVWATFKFPILPILHVAFWVLQLPLIRRARQGAWRDGVEPGGHDRATLRRDRRSA